MHTYVCPVCGNADTRAIGLLNNKPYCRKCLTFKGQEAKKDYQVNTKGDLYLSYPLTEDQSKISAQLIENFKNKENSFVAAICGSGKTEIILGVMHYCLTNGLHVGFCVPRRDVAIDLYDRFKTIFKDNSTALVYGGHTTLIQADIICCTTHQLFRYKDYFDLLIVDEVDAFPFHNNETLNSIFYRSIKGNYIMLSATASESSLKEFEKEGGKVLYLNERFHRYPLPVPEVKIGNRFALLFKLYRLIRIFEEQEKQVFIFTPTIKECESIYRFLHILVKNGNYVHSKRDNRERIIQDFKDKKYMYLVTTSVLERGVTVKDLQVVIFNASHSIYTSETLIQISGRVGRKLDAPEGKVVYLSERYNEAIQESIASINKSNKNLQNLF